MSETLITLDHPISVNGISLRFIPIRMPTRADANEAMRMRLRKRDGAKNELIRAVRPKLKPGEDLGDAVEGFALVREVTGLPFSALTQLDDADQAKIGAFLTAAASKV